MKAGNEAIRLAIIMVLMMVSVPLLQALIIACNRSNMDYLADKTVISSSRDVIRAQDYMMSLNAAQVILMPEVNDNYCPPSGNIIFVKDMNISRNNLLQARNTTIIPNQSRIDFTSAGYSVRKGTRRQTWIFETSGVGPWIQGSTIPEEYKHSNEFLWIGHVNQSVTPSGEGMSVDRVWVFSSKTPYGTW